jgi:prephenate dehydrogenase
MGGSLALALHAPERLAKACAKIIAIERDATTREHALDSGAVDQASADLALAAQADVIVLATPVRAIIELLPRVGAIARDGAIVIDLGSTKREITQALQTLPDKVQPIGGHPMCGKETAGFGSADANLFRNAVFALTPLARTSASTLAFAQSLVETIGARPLVIDADRHDKIVATTSHLPFVIAAALMSTAEDQARDDELLFRLVASGFRDTSRLAASDTTMMIDILLTNRANVTSQLKSFSEHLDALANLIDRADAEILYTQLDRIAKTRQDILRRTA